MGEFFASADRRRLAQDWCAVAPCVCGMPYYLSSLLSGGDCVRPPPSTNRKLELEKKNSVRDLVSDGNNATLDGDILTCGGDSEELDISEIDMDNVLHHCDAYY